MLLRLLVLFLRDSVKTLSAIAYNVNNSLDEVLLAIVCTVYSGNIINRGRLFLKVAVIRAFVALGSSAFNSIFYSHLFGLNKKKYIYNRNK